MTIQEQLRGELKTAMKAKEAEKLAVIRGLLTAFTNELVALKRKPDEQLEDDKALAVIKRAAKQRKDSIEQFTKGGRPELAEVEKAELKILETYLPTEMSEEEVEKVVKAKSKELGITEKSGVGIFMAAVMRELGGKADGTLVKSVVDRVLH